MPAFIALKSGPPLSGTPFPSMDDANFRVRVLPRGVQERFQRAAIGKLGLVVAVLAQRKQIFFEGFVHRGRSATRAAMLRGGPRSSKPCRPCRCAEADHAARSERRPLPFI